MRRKHGFRGGNVVDFFSAFSPNIIKFGRGGNATYFNSGNVSFAKTTLGTSTVDIAGSLATAYVAKTGSYTLTATDYTVENTSGSNTMTLPTAVGITGRIYYIVNTDAAATVTVATTSSQTFVNVTATPTTFTKVGLGTVAFQSNNAGWMVLSNY